ncbi:MAG: flagellar basal body P-ring formation chaperone FlgA [Rhodocyclaceae bacterium]
MLDDVAIIRSPDLAALKSLVDLPVGRYAGSGYSVDLDRRSLAQWVARNGPEVGPVVWEGAERVHITFATPATGQDCGGDARQVLESWLAKRYARFDVTMSGVGAALTDTQACRVRPLADATSVAARMTLWADVYEGDRFVRSVAMSAKVSAFEDVWVARAAIAAGDSATQTRFERRVSDVARESVAPLPSGWEQGGYRLVRNMAEGQRLTGAMLVASPDVERGNAAVLTTHVGSVQLEATVQVLQDGKVGATVPVRVAGGKSIMARVVSPGRLEASQ